MPSDQTEPYPPSVTTDQMREVDRAMVEEYSIQLVQLMENAGRNLAHLARTRFLNGDPRGCRVLVLAGTGGNGGGGMVCARRLSNWGADVRVFTTVPASEFQGAAKVQLKILQRSGVPLTVGSENMSLPEADLIVDAIIGYSLRGTPSGVAAALIKAANAHGAPILSLDVPSGIDASTGIAQKPAIQAAATLSLALPKTGFGSPSAAQFLGELYLADISVPPELYASPALGLEIGPIFAKDDIIRLR